MNVRPATYASLVPDRATWEEKNGAAPWVLETEPEFVAEALAWVEEDEATLDAGRASDLSDALDTLCETIAIIEGVDIADAIFFDRRERKFVVFPKPSARRDS